MKKHLLLWFLLFPFLGIYGQDGKLDSTFNSTGWERFNFGKNNIGNDYGYALLKQSDGKYLLVDAVDQQFSRLVRFNTDAALDLAYGIGGFSSDVGFYYESAAIQKDDKVVVAGSVYSATATMVVARFKTNGTADSSFGNNGLAYASVPPYTSVGHVVVSIDSSGRVVVAAIAYDSVNAFIIARFTQDGVLDSEFNSIGTAVFPAETNSYVSAIGIQQDGNVIIGGFYHKNYNSYFNLLRILSDGASPGTLDPMFGSGGTVSVTIGYDMELYALAIQKNDDKIVVGGSVGMPNKKTGPVPDFIVMRFTKDGSLDPTFNVGSTYTGTVITNFGANEYVNSITIGQNSIIAVGCQYAYPKGVETQTVAIACYQFNGTLDNSFDKDGMLLSNFSGWDNANSVLLESNGSILIGGSTRNITNGSIDLLLARYTTVGELDVNFNSDGARPGVASCYYGIDVPSIITATTVQPDGKIIVTGVLVEQHIPGFFISRLNADGTLDESFGNYNGYPGIAVAEFGSGNAFPITVSIVPGTGNIVVGGFVGTSGADLVLAQFTKDGLLDNGFGIGGIVIADFNSNFDILTSMVLQTDGKIVVGGASFSQTSMEAPDFMLARYTTSGLLDQTFGTNGVTMVDFKGAEDLLTSLALVPTGILAVGTIMNPTTITPTQEFGITRLTANGNIDLSFGANGIITTGIEGNDLSAISLAVQPEDGKILVSGTGEISGTSNKYNLLIRYSSEGVMDETFGEGGIVSDTFMEYNSKTLNMDPLILPLGIAVMVQADGKIIVTSPLEPKALLPASIENPNFFGVARFTTDGSLDPTFGTSGKFISDFTTDATLTSAKWFNGRLYTAGFSFEDNAYGFVAVYKAGEYIPVTTSISIDDVTVNSSAGTATLTVTMNKTSSLPVIINYTTKDNTATGKGKTPDYKSTKGVVTILAGNTTATIAIPVYSGQPQNDKSFYVNLSLTKEMANLVSLEKATGIVTITYGPIGPGYTKLNKQDNEQNVAGNLVVKAMPNPSTNAFTIELQSAVNAPATIRVMDISGRLIESRTGIAPNSRLQIGHNYKPGAYYAEIVQGNEKLVLRLVKQ